MSYIGLATIVRFDENCGKCDFYFPYLAMLFARCMQP